MAGVEPAKKGREGGRGGVGVERTLEDGV